jgi:hypothetical protein
MDNTKKKKNWTDRYTNITKYCLLHNGVTAKKISARILKETGMDEKKCQIKKINMMMLTRDERVYDSLRCTDVYRDKIEHKCTLKVKIDGIKYKFTSDICEFDFEAVQDAVDKLIKAYAKEMQYV